jgi:hypothetical protein
LAHTTEPILWTMGDLDGGTEHLKPLTGLAGYGVVSAGLFLEKKWGLYASIVLPTVFWVPHLVFLGTNAVGWTDRPNRFNGYNIPMVAMEGFVMVRSIQLLKRGQGSSSFGKIHLGTTGRGLYLTGQF